MQKDFNGDFDLQIATMLKAAEEPAPAGAWDAISSRLDSLQAAAAAPAASGGSRVRRAWYWAGAALAMAASLVLGIFVFSPKGDNSNLINIEPSSSIVAESVVPAEKAEKSFRQVEKPSASGIVAESVVPVEKAPESRPQVEKPSAPAEKPSAPAEKPSSPAEKPSSTVQPETETPAKSVDPFAAMAFEDAGKTGFRKGFSAVLSGGMSNNNVSAGMLAQAAPGSYSVSSITEKSQSDYGIPVTFGAGIRYRVNEVFSVGTGVDYSLLVRTFSGTYTNGPAVNSDIRHTVQYVGVPFDVFVHFPEARDLSFYANAGVEIEKAVSNRYSIISSGDVVEGDVKGLQWSLGAGLGMEFNMGSKTGLFVEPSARYYFDCGQPKSVRTDKPFQVILRAGLRFNLN